MTCRFLNGAQILERKRGESLGLFLCRCTGVIDNKMNKWRQKRVKQQMEVNSRCNMLETSSRPSQLPPIQCNHAVTGLQHEDKDLKMLHCSLIVCFHEQLVGLVTVPH